MTNINYGKIDHHQNPGMGVFLSRLRLYNLGRLLLGAVRLEPKVGSL